MLDVVEVRRFEIAFAQQPKATASVVLQLSADVPSFSITKLGCHKNQPPSHGAFLLPRHSPQACFNPVRTFAALHEKAPALSSDLEDQDPTVN